MKHRQSNVFHKLFLSPQTIHVWPVPLMCHPLKFQTEKATEETLVVLNFHVHFTVLGDPIKPILATSDSLKWLQKQTDSKIHHTSPMYVISNQIQIF